MAHTDSFKVKLNNILTELRNQSYNIEPEVWKGDLDAAVREAAKLSSLAGHLQAVLVAHLAGINGKQN